MWSMPTGRREPFSKRGWRLNPTGPAEKRFDATINLTQAKSVEKQNIVLNVSFETL